MDEIIYTIIRIDEDDYGCEERPDGYMPMVRVSLEAEDGSLDIVMMEDSLMYARGLDVGVNAVIGGDGTLYHPDKVFDIEDIKDSDINIDKQMCWMENYWDALDEYLGE